MTTAQRIGGILVLGGAAALLYLWWKRRKATSLSTGSATVGPLEVVSWNVAPAQAGTPNTPTVDPVWASRNRGVSPV